MKEEKYIVTEDFEGMSQKVHKGDILLLKGSVLYLADKYISAITSHNGQNYCKPYPEYPSENVTFKEFPYTINWNCIDSDGNTNGSSMNVKGETIKFICNKGTSIIILEDGTKGIAKCLPNDKFDIEKGFSIALKKAKIQQLQNELQELYK